MITRTLSVGSLFAGIPIGGFDLGFERAGFAVKWQVEIDPWARAVLAKHWPNVHRHDDIRTAGAHNLEAVDVLCGGFPCQDISLAGKGAGMAEGTRSGLWSEYARLIRELRPRYVVVENVAALLARGLGRVVGDLAACGYDAEWDCIPAAAVGAPHRRDRLWLVAYPGCEGREPGGLRGGFAEAREVFDVGSSDGREDVADSTGVQPREAGEQHSRSVAARHRGAGSVSGTPEGKALADSDSRRRVRGGEQEPTGQQGACGHITDRRSTGRAGAAPHVSDSECRRRRGGNVELAASASIFSTANGGLRFASEYWATEPDLCRVAHGVPARVDRLRGLGNAIVPQIAEWIAHRIKEAEARRVAA